MTEPDKPADLPMWHNVVETFRCIAKAKRNVPGMSIEYLLGDATADEIDSELQFLQAQVAKLESKT